MRANTLRHSIHFILVGAFGLSEASTALAQQPPMSTVALEEIVVTGTHLRDPSLQAALPVATITADDLAKLGTPSNTELIKSLPAIGATIAGDANPLQASRVEGASSINLRGLGNARTLVLFNGVRIPTMSSGTQTLIDINSLPMAAVDRVDILKDGAAATYGSDAIAGVVNFITRRDFTGVDLGADYSFIKGSGGDYTARALAGWSGESTHFLGAIGFQHRSELQALDRSFANRSYVENPFAWSTFGNPGVYQASPGTVGSTTITDPGCVDAGGTLTPLPSVGVPATAANCLLHFTQFDNLVEEQNSYQIYGELWQDLAFNTKFHMEAFYSNTDVPHVASTPSATLAQFPTTTSTGGVGGGRIAGRYFIPASNPGLIALLAQYPGAIAGGNLTAAQTTGINNATAAWRPLGWGGNAAYDGFANLDHRKYESWRTSAGFDGLLGPTSWSVTGTYGETKADSSAADILASRLEYALRGLGGPNCDPTTGTPGVGACGYFNPFSTGIAANAVTGVANPHYVASTANDPALVAWMFGPDNPVVKTQLTVVDAQINGDLGLKLPGGAINWAVGAQYRKTKVDVSVDDFLNLNITPCIDIGSTACTTGPTAAPNGPYAFYGGITPTITSQSISSAYVEFSLPILDSLIAQVAGRYEHHDAGDTSNPKLSLSWNPLEWFALRGSIGSNYRAPTVTQLDDQTKVTVAQISAAANNQRVPFDTYGNASLKPETATTYNVGLVFKPPHTKISIDYWSYRLKDQLTTENGPAILNALFPSSSVNHCGDPAYTELQARITFINGTCSGGANIGRVRIESANGAPIDTSGIDLAARFSAEIFAGVKLDAGVDGTYILTYDVGATQTLGLTTIPAFSAVGNLNFGLGVLSLPKWRASMFVGAEKSIHAFRWVVNYIDGMHDQRADTRTIGAQLGGYPAGTAALGGFDIGSFLTHDIHYLLSLPHDYTVSATVTNVFDRAPPFAQITYSYDAFTANPLGRIFKVGIKKSF